MTSISTLCGKNEHTDNDEDKRNTVVKDVFQKLRIHLRVLGIYFDLCGSNTSSKPRKLALGLLSVMSILYLASVWFFQLRLVPVIVREELFSTRFLQVALLFFMYLSALWNFSCSIYLVRKHWRDIVHGLISECTLTEHQHPYVLRHFGKFLFTFFILGCSVPLFSVIGLFIAEGSSPPSEMTLFRLYPATPNTTFWFTMKCFYTYFAFISYQQVFAYCLVITTFCYILKREFQQVTNTLEREHMDHTMSRLLEDQRQKHERLCTLTRTVDSVLSSLVFGFYFTGILSICFCVSCFSAEKFPKSQIPTLVSMTLIAATQMIVCTLVGVLLNREANKPKDILLKIKAGELRRVDFQCLSVFLTQISSQEIGITALGLFTVNKSAFLTIVGTIFTYAVVVQQLNYGIEVVDQTGRSNVTGVIL